MSGDETEVLTSFERTSGRARWTWLAVDTTALLMLAALIAVAFWPVYGVGWLFVTVLGGSALGLLIAWMAWRQRFNPALTVLLTALLWCLAGPALAMPSATTAHVVPTLRGLHGMAVAPVTAWKQMLTLQPPIGETWNLLAVPLCCALVASLAGSSISLRTARPAWAWVPSGVAIVVAWALGANASVRPFWFAMASVAVVLVWTSYRRAHQRQALLHQSRRLRLSSVAVGAALLAVVGLVTAGVGPTVHSNGARKVVRHAVAPPLVVSDYASPLQAFRGNHTMWQRQVLFTVSGAPAGSAVQVAVLDRWDGATYVVTSSDNGTAQQGQFTRVGSRVAVPAPGREQTITVSIAQYDSVWLPLTGQLRSIRFTGAHGVRLGDQLFYNRQLSTGIDTAGLTTGDGYTATVVVPDQPTSSQVATADAGQVAQPEPASPPDAVRELVTRWTAGTSTAGAAVLAIEQHLKQGYYSNGLPGQTPSRSGHSSGRIDDLLANPAAMVGDEEQYAVAMALMASSLGIPSRVVTGYVVPASGQVTGDDVRAWPEVNLKGLGWVRLNPTPPRDRVLDQPATVPKPAIRPHVDNPPPDPQRPENVPPDTSSTVTPPEPAPPPKQIDWRRVGIWALLFGLPLVTLVIPPLVLVGAKVRRRRLRRRAPSVVRRYSGAWAELVDRARDLGQSPAVTATRSEQAEQLVIAFPRSAEADPIGLAKAADAAVFGPEQPSAPAAEAYWVHIENLERALRKSVGTRRWARGLLSMRSFRHFTQAR